MKKLNKVKTTAIALSTTLLLNAQMLSAEIPGDIDNKTTSLTNDLKIFAPTLALATIICAALLMMFGGNIAEKGKAWMIRILVASFIISIAGSIVAFVS